MPRFKAPINMVGPIVAGMTTPGTHPHSVTLTGPLPATITNRMRSRTHAEQCIALAFILTTLGNMCRDQGYNMTIDRRRGVDRWDVVCTPPPELQAERSSISRSGKNLADVLQIVLEIIAHECGL